MLVLLDITVTILLLKCNFKLISVKRSWPLNAFGKLGKIANQRNKCQIFVTMFHFKIRYRSFNIWPRNPFIEPALWTFHEVVSGFEHLHEKFLDVCKREDCELRDRFCFTRLGPGIPEILAINRDKTNGILTVAMVTATQFLLLLHNQTSPQTAADISQSSTWFRGKYSGLKWSN